MSTQIPTVSNLIHRIGFSNLLFFVWRLFKINAANTLIANRIGNIPHAADGATAAGSKSFPAIKVKTSVINCAATNVLKNTFSGEPVRRLRYDTSTATRISPPPNSPRGNEPVSDIVGWITGSRFSYKIRTIGRKKNAAITPATRSTNSGNIPRDTPMKAWSVKNPSVCLVRRRA